MGKNLELACTECHRIIEVPTGNLGWCLKSDPDMQAKTKKNLIHRSFLAKNAREPTPTETKDWAKRMKDDITRVKSRQPQCPYCPAAHLSADWQGYVVILNPERSEIAAKLNIERSGNYALKVSI